MNVILMSRIDSEAVAILSERHDVVSAYEASEEERRDLVRDRDVLVFRSGVEVSADLITAAPLLRLIVRAGSGYDNVDIEAARAAGIRVLRIPGPSAQAVAEFALGLMFALSRNLALADRLVRQGRWPKASLGGPLLAGKVLGIVGMGSIGARLAELANALGMHVVACVRRPETRDSEVLAAQGIQLDNLEGVVSQADYLVVATPLDDSTHHLIDAAALSRMKPGSYLVNVARGGVVDEKALLDALIAEGGLGGAALDVHEREGEGTMPRLARLDNVILTPHIAGSALEAQRAIGLRLIELLDAYVSGTLESETRAVERIV